MSWARSLVYAAASMLFVAPAQAQRIGEPIDRSAYPVIDTFDRFVPLEEPDDPATPPAGEGGFAPRGGPLAFYSSGFNPFSPVSYFATEGGHNGLVDDYIGTRIGDTGLHLGTFAFIGGALSPAMGGSGGQRIYFDFFDNEANLLSGFIWDAPSYQQGAWFISINPADEVLVDNAGFVQVSGAPGVPNVLSPTTVRWWYTRQAQVGSNEGGLPADSMYPHTVYTFELTGGPNIPAAPSGLGLPVLCTVSAVRRRR